jgi:glutathione S-transferase
MAEFTIHSIPGSPYGRAVLSALEEKHADYEFASVQPGALRAEPHILRHPFGKIPVLEHKGFALYECQAILRYIDRVLPDPALTPADPRAAARMDQVMNINDWYLFQGAGNVIGFQRVVGPALLGLSPDEAAIAEVMPRAHLVFAELARLLGDQAFFAGSQVSLADLMIAPHMEFFTRTPEWSVLGEPHPNLVEWIARMEGRPSLKATTWDRVAEMAAAA